MLYGTVIIVVFVYITIRVHLRLRERGEQGVPIVGDLLGPFFGKSNTSSEMVPVGTKFDSKDDVKGPPKNTQPSFEEPKRYTAVKRNSMEMDTTSGDTTGEQEDSTSKRSTMSTDDSLSIHSTQ